MAAALSPSAIAHAITVGNGLCVAGEYCLYIDSGYVGSVADFTGDSNISTFVGREYFNTNTTVNDKTSSTRNNDPDSIFLYGSASYSGSIKCNDSGENTASYGAFNDSASSLLVSSGTCGAIGP